MHLGQIASAYGLAPAGHISEYVADLVVVFGGLVDILGRNCKIPMNYGYTTLKHDDGLSTLDTIILSHRVCAQSYGL